MAKRHPAEDMPFPKGYMCAAGCGHGIAVHREHGCDVVDCDCPAPFGRIMPGDPPPVPRAADLAEGSVVATAERAWIKAGAGLWRGTHPGYMDGSYADSRIDAALDSGRAQVLRVGTGKEGSE